MVSQTYYQNAVDQAMGGPEFGRDDREVRRLLPPPRPVDDVIEVAGLTETRASGVVQLSGGQQRRVQPRRVSFNDAAPGLLVSDLAAPELFGR
jgi:hypothetical protein